MLPTIIYLLLRRYPRNHPEKAKKIGMMPKPAGRLLFATFCLLTMTPMKIIAINNIFFI